MDHGNQLGRQKRFLARAVAVLPVDRGEKLRSVWYYKGRI